MNLSLPSLARGRLRRWLHGEDREVARFVGRWEVAATAWRTPADIAAVLSRGEASRPASVVFGPIRQLPWQHPIPGRRA